MKTKFPILFAVLACAFLVLRELLFAQTAPFNYPPAAAASGLQAMNQNQFDSSSTNIKSGALLTNVSLANATNTGTYYSTGSGVSAPFYTFSGAATTGLGNSGGYALLFSEGVISLAAKDSLKEVRVPSNYKFGFSSSTDNTANLDTILDRVAAGVVGTTNLAVTNLTASTVTLSKTITAVGTTGNQTINKPIGRVNIAAAGTSVIVTNSLVTTNSIIHAVAATADASARVTSVVAGTGEFTINTVATTAETAFNFIVVN